MKPEPADVIFIEDRSTRGSRCYQQSGIAHIHLDGQHFPIVAKHIQQIQLKRCVESWPEWLGQDMRSGSPTYNMDSLKELLRDKSEQIGDRYRSTGNPNGSPEWLIILCDLEVDICTDIIPTSDEERRNIDLFFKECGHDFSDCPIDQIWLMSEKSGKSYRVYPFRELAKEEIL